MIIRLLRTATYSGILAGFVLGILLILIMAPIIFHAEAVEVPGHVLSLEEIFRRDSLTLLGAVVLALAYGFLMALAANFLFKELSFLKKGALLGLGGFLLFYGLPFLGQPPILPGMEACSPVALRQLWYLEVLIFAALAISVYVLMSHWIKIRWLAFFLALFVLMVPFIAGIPNGLEGNKVPEVLIFQFRIASFGVNLIFWLTLGLLVSYFGIRFSNTSHHD